MVDSGLSGEGAPRPAEDPDLEAARASARTDPPGADLALSVTGRLFRLAERLVDLQDRGAREYGLGFARGRVLWALADSGPVVMRALSQALGISPRTVTGLVDALEADGWVTRSPHPADRRATLISLTPAAETALAGLRENYAALARDLLGDVDPEDLARCRSVIATLEERLDGVVARRAAAFGPGAGRRPRADLARRDPARKPARWFIRADDRICGPGVARVRSDKSDKLPARESRIVSMPR